MQLLRSRYDRACREAFAAPEPHKSTEVFDFVRRFASESSHSAQDDRGLEELKMTRSGEVQQDKMLSDYFARAFANSSTRSQTLRTCLGSSR